MKHKIFLSAAIGLLFLAPAEAKKNNVLDVSASITDSSIIFPESFEVDTQKLLEGWYMKNYTATDDSYKTKDDPATSDETIIRRLKALPTEIELPFNSIVRSYIDRYTKGGRAQLAAILGLSNYYMPIFEQALEQEGLPLELKYLPVIESALDPNAVSKHGATGLWQFMLGASKGLGMEVNTLVDERRDPYISSEKAAKFLKDLYATYGDWSLVIAAYNCGPGTVNKAIRRAGGDPQKHDFWSIYNYLPSETRGYVPAFIAANYVMNYYKEHNINPVLATKPLVMDTVAVNRRIHFDQISNVLDIPVDELEVLNPQYRKNIIPGTPDHTYFLTLPSQQVQAYIMSEDKIFEFNAGMYDQRETVEPGASLADNALAEMPVVDMEDTSEEDVAMVQAAAAATSNKKNASSGKKTIMHKVGSGETIASIAKKYGVETADIKSWNGLRRSAVRQGQQLKIMVDASSPAAQQASTATATTTTRAEQQTTTTSQPKASSKKKNEQAAAAKKKKQEPARPTSVTVKSGENLSTIARKNGVTVEELKKANGMKDDKLKAGQTLTIPAKKSSAKKSSAKSSSAKSSSAKKSSSKKSSSKKSSKKKKR